MEFHPESDFISSGRIIVNLNFYTKFYIDFFIFAIKIRKRNK